MGVPIINTSEFEKSSQRPLPITDHTFALRFTGGLLLTAPATTEAHGTASLVRHRSVLR